MADAIGLSTAGVAKALSQFLPSRLLSPTAEKEPLQ